MKNRTYIGIATGTMDLQVFYADHEAGLAYDHLRVLDVERSLKVANHSPTGFSAGYGGSGPSQLALALILEETDNEELAQRMYQEFKWEVIAKLPQTGGWAITSKRIRNWLFLKGA